MEAMGGGCSTPIGVNARLEGNLRLIASILSPDGEDMIQYRKMGEASDPRGFGKIAALEALEQGASRIVEKWG